MRGPNASDSILRHRVQQKFLRPLPHPSQCLPLSFDNPIPCAQNHKRRHSEKSQPRVATDKAKIRQGQRLRHEETLLVRCACPFFMKNRGIFRDDHLLPRLLHSQAQIRVIEVHEIPLVQQTYFFKHRSSSQNARKGHVRVPIKLGPEHGNESSTRSRA